MKMKKEGENKKLIIAIIIGIVLVITIGIIFFNLEKQKTTPDSVSEQCKFACDSGQTNLFCLWDMKISDDLIATCKTLSENSNYIKYGVEPCPTIKC
jgi:ABC-type antimicrobial peptide transport system permease subunit